MGYMKNLYIEILIHVEEVFSSKCAYCQAKIKDEDKDIDAFYPAYKYPELEYLIDNYVLSCPLCQLRKGSFSPVDSNGNEIIINPLKDKFDEHISVNDTGYFVPLTPKGVNTINLFALNRRELIEQRLKETISVLSNDENYSSIEAILASKGAYSNFHDNRRKIIEIINELENSQVINKEYLINMLYANTITLLESYLSDTFIQTVLSNNAHIRKFVETFHDYKKETLKMTDIYTNYESLNAKVTKSMMDVIYHNIDKVKGMYKDTLEVSFPKDISKIFLAIKNRHDIVHRNGRRVIDKSKRRTIIDLDENMPLLIGLNLSVHDVKDILIEVEMLVEFIQEQINSLNVYKEFKL